MAEHRLSPSSRLASVSSSPSRPSPLSRPHWPWSTYTHRSSSSASVFSSTTSSSISTSDSRHSTSSTVLRPTTPGAGKSPAAIIVPDHAEEMTMRQWSFAAFEWVVRDVHKLRDFVEGTGGPALAEGEPPSSHETDSPEADDFEILRESPTLGDGKFKLEIGNPSVQPSDASETLAPKAGPQTLSLYITSLMVDYANTDYELCTSMFAAIKCQDDRLGERGARAEWAWEHWQDGWIFRQESEVWACPLPSLSTLLQNSRIKETDSFVICIQIHSPVGPFFPQQPSAYYVPRDLLDGLEASLDNPNTGDVQFVCLERKEGDSAPDSALLSPITGTPMSSFSSTSSHSLHPQTLARKRIIYAHSDILMRRSDYFTTMLSSAFSENSGAMLPGERKMYTVVVEEADFATIYWLLKWVYANWVLLRKEDDPREAVDGIGAGWSAKGLSRPGAPDEWEWKAFSKGTLGELPISGGASDARSITSGDGERESAISGSRTEKEKDIGHRQSQATVTPQASRSRGAPTGNTKSTLSPARPTNARRASAHAPVPPAINVPPLSSTSPNPSRSGKGVPLALSPVKSNYTSPPRYPGSARGRQSSTGTPDPHPHPAAQPPPASALSMYQIAHRYAMPGLAGLALEHILSTIEPRTCFAVLLATVSWEELHSLVEDYVVEKWDDVSVSAEFERCCQEVAAGEWGPEGGKTLMELFRRLRSPSALLYSRN